MLGQIILLHVIVCFHSLLFDICNMNTTTFRKQKKKCFDLLIPSQWSIKIIACMLFSVSFHLLFSFFFTRFFLKKKGYINFVPKLVHQPSVCVSLSMCVRALEFLVLHRPSNVSGGESCAHFWHVVGFLCSFL